MAKYRITGPDGNSYDVSAPDDASQDDVLAYAQRNFKFAAVPKQEAPAEPFGQRLNREIGDIPRQLGLTARHALNGIGSAVGMFSDPVGGVINATTGSHLQTARSLTDQLADKVGLPQPQNSTERIIGTGAEMLVPAAGTTALAGRAANGASGVTQKVLQGMAANPGKQLAGAASSGLAGQYTKETGGDEMSQFAASLAAGVATPTAMGAAENLANAATNAVRRFRAPPATPQVDVTITNALRDSGVTFADLPANVRAGIRNDVQAALRTGGELSPDAVRRLADYRLTGATPTAATLTLDPAAVSQQKNLAKLGINSKDRAAQQLGQLENANNRQLIDNLNNLGAQQAPGQFATGERLVDSLSNYAAAQRGEIGRLYDAARDSQGRAASLDPQAFSTMANNLLDHNLRGAFVPENIRSMMNDFAVGRVPLNIQSAEQFKTIIGNAQRGATDGNVRAALGHIREALDNTPLQADTAVAPAAVNGGNQIKPLGGVSTEMRPNIGQDTLDAFNRARAANRGFMQTVEATPALAQAMDGAHPDQFFQRHVVNAPVADLQATLGVIGDQGRDAMRREVVNYLKSKALNGAADEVGNFSQSAYNKALNALGEEKLSMLFPREELAQLRAVGRVASYEQFQPRGSAVNNSNTAGTGLAAVLDRVANSPILSKIPFGNQIAAPAQNIAIGMRSSQALNVPRGLLAPELAGVGDEPVGLLLSPAMFMQPKSEKKKGGLLAP